MAAWQQFLISWPAAEDLSNCFLGKILDNPTARREILHFQQILTAADMMGSGLADFSRRAEPDVEEISLIDMILIIRSHLGVLLLIVIVGAIISGIVAFVTKPVFRAEALVSPLSFSEGGAGGNSLGQRLGGLAGLVGLSVGGNAESNRNIAILNSRILGEKFIDKYQLRTRLFPELWDGVNHKWRKPRLQKYVENLPAGLQTLIYRFNIVSRYDPVGPSRGAVYRKFNKIRSISKDADTGLVTVAMEWHDPSLAAQWVNEYLKLANEYIRQKSIADSKRRLDFLYKNVNATNVTGIRSAFYKVMEQEIKYSMLLNSRDEFAFKVIDPAVAPDLRVWPKRKLIVLIGIAVSFMLGVVLIIFSHALAERKKRVSEVA